MRTVRLETPLRVDGRLDEASIRRSSRSATSSSRSRAKAQPATEKTEAWILFDDANLYIAARCWDSHPEREVANELRRDNGNILGNENFTVRHRHVPRPAQRLPVPDQPARRAARHDGHRRPAELGVERHLVREDRPLRRTAGRWRWRFRSSRCATAAAAPQTWGINLRRLVKWKNEFSYLSLVPAALGTRRRQPHGVGGDAGRPRDAGAVEEPRAEAVRRVVGDHRSRPRRRRSTTTRTATPASTSSTG